MKELDYFVYQIYPKSFLDTTGNGIGDINGIRSKLKYIAELGFDYIWITPMFVSPQKDNGYDVGDYLNFDPIFGNDEDFDNLVMEADQLGLKIMFDMVFNHTSTSHEWFQKAIAGDIKYQDYYIWRDTPTNWESKFGGNAWEYEPKLGKYYLHLFDKTQADLNWENELVRQELYNIVNYWLDKGVKGFRFDVVNLISKQYPIIDGNDDGRSMYTDGPRVHEFLQMLRENTFADDESVLTVGEMSSTSIESCLQFSNSNRSELDSVFHFHHLKVDYLNGDKWSRNFFDFEMLKQLLSTWQLSMQKNDVVDTLFWSCHDQPRIASRFIPANTLEKQLRKNKMLCMLMYLMRGISYIFQGEEIGMENLNYSKIDDFRDVESINYFHGNPELPLEERIESLCQKSRDNGRSPMQWSASGGFSTTTPWIKYNNNLETVNVEQQLNDNQSTLSFYKHIIKLKKSDLVLSKGNIEFIDDEHLIIYTRKYQNKQYKIVCNMWDSDFSYQDTIDEIIINNDCNIEENCIHLAPFSSILYQIKS